MNKVLFVGIGGGNDIFSTLLVALALKKAGWKWSEAGIAGVLSPFHTHYNKVTNIPNVVRITPGSTRFLTTNHTPPVNIGFIDAAVSRLLAEDDIRSACNITDQLGISLEQGSYGVSTAFSHLSQIYDFIVLVDVGGDCFYGGKDDAGILSPMFDALALRGFCDSSARGLLAEFGPGTDCELGPESLEEKLDCLSSEEVPVKPDTMAQWEHLYRTYIASVRTGRTVPNSIAAYASQDDMLSIPFKVRAHIGTVRMYDERVQKVKPANCKSIYLVDPRKIHNPFAVQCTDPLGWFTETQSLQHRTNCEANLEYYRKDGKLIQLLTPSPLFSITDQQKMIECGLDGLRSGRCDACIMFTEDIKQTSMDEFSLTHPLHELQYVTR